MAKRKHSYFALFLVSVFSFILSGMMLKKTLYAQVGNADILTKEDMGDFEKLTFYETKKENLVNLYPEGERSRNGGFR